MELTVQPERGPHAFTRGAARLFGAPAPYLVGFGPEIASLKLPYRKVIVSTRPGTAELMFSLAEEAQSIGPRDSGFAEGPAFPLRPDLLQLDNLPPWPVAVLEPSETSRQPIMELFLQSLPERIRDSVVRMLPGSDFSTLVHEAMRRHATQLFEQSVAADRALAELRQLHQVAQRTLAALETLVGETNELVDDGGSMSTLFSEEAHPTGEIPVLRPLSPKRPLLQSYLDRIDDNRIYSNFGPLSVQLGERLVQDFGLPSGSVICASSGTAALMAAILAEAGPATAQRPLAVVPSFTFAATALAVERCGYEPLLMDVGPDEWMLLPESIQRASDASKVGLVVPVAPFGRPVDQAPWLDFHHRTGIPVVIDAAASFESFMRRDTAVVDTVPTVLSFHATKVFSTGEGGAVLSPRPDYIARVVRALNFGLLGDRNCRAHGLNGKMSEYHAAVGLAELDIWSQKQKAFRRVAFDYERAFEALAIRDLLIQAPAVASCYTLVRCLNAAEADRLSAGLRKEGIGHRTWYGQGLHAQPHFQLRTRGEFPVTESLGSRLVGIPAGPTLSRTQIDTVANAVARHILDNG